MNKVALANKIAEKVGVSKKEAEQMISAFVDVVTETLKSGDVVNIAGFGAFSAKVRAGRIGVNPQNPQEKIEISPVTVPKFKAGKTLKDELKGKKSKPTPQAEPIQHNTPTEPTQPSEPQAPEPMQPTSEQF
jgi:DNA-binding protein HU-beta